MAHQLADIHLHTERLGGPSPSAATTRIRPTGPTATVALTCPARPESAIADLTAIW